MTLRLIHRLLRGHGSSAPNLPVRSAANPTFQIDRGIPQHPTPIASRLNNHSRLLGRARLGGTVTGEAHGLTNRNLGACVPVHLERHNRLNAASIGRGRGDDHLAIVDSIALVVAGGTSFSTHEARSRSACCSTP